MAMSAVNIINYIKINYDIKIIYAYAVNSCAAFVFANHFNGYRL
jgi:hypothetical protein